MTYILLAKLPVTIMQELDGSIVLECEGATIVVHNQHPDKDAIKLLEEDYTPQSAVTLKAGDKLELGDESGHEAAEYILNLWPEVFELIESEE